MKQGKWWTREEASVVARLSAEHLQAKPATESGPKILYGISNIADYFGVHKSTIHQWVARYEFPVRKFGTLAFLSLDELKRWGRSEKSLQRRGIRGLLPVGYLPTVRGVTKEMVVLHLEKNGGVCDICRKALSDNGLSPHVDHDHMTGMVRGVLCRGCNHGIGNFQDSAEILRRAISYLEQPPWGSNGSEKAR